ncbi:MAG: glycosyltransferase [Betaproteobacteria bacterium]
MENNRKPQIVRVVTASYVVPWHLHNTLLRMTDDFEVTVIGQDVSTNRENYPGVQWVDINLNRKFSPLADVSSLWALYRFFQKNRPDVVHSIMPKAGLLAAFAGFAARVPVRMHTFTGQTWVNQHPVGGFLLYGLDRLINALNSVCLTDSRSQSEFLLEHGFAHDAKALPVLGEGSLSGVDLTRFSFPRDPLVVERLRKKFGLGEQDFVFAFIARKSRDKGALDMVRAFAPLAASHPRARLLFVGPDESAGELLALKARSPQLFERVIEVERVVDHEAYLAVTDVLCLPSFREGFGSIVIDAAASGVPAIGSRIVGLVDSIEDGKTGVLFAAGAVDELVNAMQALLENPQRAKDMGAAARQRIEARFSAERLYGLLKEFYLAQLRK